MNSFWILLGRQLIVLFALMVTSTKYEEADYVQSNSNNTFNNPEKYIGKSDKLYFENLDPIGVS